MPYQMAIQFFTALRDLPPKQHFILAAFLGFGATIADKVAPETQIGLSGLIGMIVALLAGWRALKNDDANNRRRDKILEAKLEAFRKGDIEPIQKRTAVQEQKIDHVKKNQKKIKSTLKGIEELRNLGILASAPPSSSILIVDDDPTWVNQLGRFFVRNLGPFNLLQAMDVPSALEEVKKAPRCIFLDIKLGDRSGLELIAPAKSYNPDVKVVVVTGWSDPKELEGAVLLGAEIWRKPICPADLQRIIRSLRTEFGSPVPSSDEIPVNLSASMVGTLPGKEKGASSG